jgi:hypothetical protein
MLKELCEELMNDGVNVKLVSCIRQVRDFIRFAGLEKYLCHLRADTHIHEIINEFNKKIN